MALFGNTGGFATVLGLALFTTSLAAQSMTVSGGGVLTGGTKADITYENAARAGQTVVVRVSGGTPLVTIEIPVLLDSTGKGTGTWLVIGAWWSATFNAPDVREVSCGIK